MLAFKDNREYRFPTGKDSDNLNLISNRSIQELVESNPELLVFPQNLCDCEDDIKHQPVFKTDEYINSHQDRMLHLSTGNIVGFIGINFTQISICSRFANNGHISDDYFLHYMLQKVLSLNVVDLQHFSSHSISLLDYLMILFPRLLKDAISQGIFREYLWTEHNDDRVRGAINVARHVNKNIPFNGKIAYRSREYSCDNRITELVRHTVEYMQTTPLGRLLLNNDRETMEGVRLITSCTSRYCKQDRRKIVLSNRQRLNHPYFTKYRPLQALCIQILRHDTIEYNETENKAYGILFDCSWLWEEYLNTILIDFKHPQNRKSEGGIYLGNGAFPRYPDFYKGKENGVVLDAKYKHSVDERNDIHQVISYMYALKSRYGGFILPTESEKHNSTVNLNGYGKKIGMHYVLIPQECVGHKVFSEQMQINEKKFILELERSLA